MVLVNVEVKDGEGFEAAVFGFSHLQVEKTHRRYCGQPPLDVCIRRVRNLQSQLGWSPRRPTTKVSKALFRTVASHLGKYKNKLRMFCALGTVLDFIHGTDLFFECNGRIVTVDLTISKKGKVSPKAMIVITLQDMIMNRYYQKASRIADLLLREQ